MRFVPCVCWVKRGVAANRPSRVKLNAAELGELLDNVNSISETSPSESDRDHAASTSEVVEAAAKPRPKEESAKAIDDFYGLENYDKDEEPSTSGLAGTMAANITKQNDPFQTNMDSDSDVDEDFLIDASDNLMVLGRVDKDSVAVEVYVVDDAGDCYVHHDYPVEDLPLCMESLEYDPGSEDGSKGLHSILLLFLSSSGNLLLIGGMSPVIQVWDLNIVDSVDPVVKLGKAPREGAAKKRKRITHTDAVLSVSWNRNLEHIVASGSADHSVILWDVEVAKGSSALNFHEEKVQSVCWHPTDANTLLSGSCDKKVHVVDARSESKTAELALDGEVEQAIWDAQDPHYVLACSDNGSICDFDVRRPDAACSRQHLEGVDVTGLSLNGKGCLASTGDDGTCRFFKVDSGVMELLGENSVGIGRLHCCTFNPDNPWLLALGGEKGDLIKVYDPRLTNGVHDAFSDGSTNAGGDFEAAAET